MPSHPGLCWFVSGLLACAAPEAAARPTPLPDHHGKAVASLPRLLPAPPLSDLRGILRGQDMEAGAALARIPGREALRAAIAATEGLTTQVGMLAMAGGVRFYLKRSARWRGARLMMRDRAGRETVLIDPQALWDAQQSAEIDQFAPSADASMVGVAISKDGSRDRVLRVVAAASAGALPDAIKGRAAGNPLLGRRRPQLLLYAAGSRASAHLYLLRHWLGTDPARDPVVLDSEHLPFPSRSAPTMLGISVTPGSEVVLAEVSDAAQPELTLYVRFESATGRTTDCLAPALRALRSGDRRRRARQPY